MFILIVIYVIAALLLAVYGLNAWVLTALYVKHRKNRAVLAKSGVALPTVTIQLPIFNEALVVKRLIDTVAHLDYPPHLLQIQVLDDSTDETTDIALDCVAHHRQQGLNIELIHRQNRAGFKAGALKEAMDYVTGQFVVIFDADFVPKPDFLKQTIPHFLSNAKLGLVQTRWGHINTGYSHLTATQAIAIDGHFIIEQTARNRSGLLMNFNGTAGVWRRDCIEAAGGWQADTICEDFDLSYRAQLGGWDCLYLPDVEVPAEIPPQLAAFKQQQFRWAKGSIQCLKKLGWRVFRSPLAWPIKLQAFIHLSNYLAHPLIVTLALITPILIMTGSTAKIRFPLIYLSLASLGPPFLYAVSQFALYPTSWKARYKRMPILILLGSGIALSTTKAVIEAFLGVGHIFRRTPKFNIVSTRDTWQHSSYRLLPDWLIGAELALGLYSLFGAWIAATNGNMFAVPFILLYAFSFGYVGLQGLWDTRTDLQGWVAARFRTQPGQAKSVRSSVVRSSPVDAFKQR